MRNTIWISAAAAVLMTAGGAVQAVQSAQEQQNAASYERFKARVAAVEDARGLPHADVDAAVSHPEPDKTRAVPAEQPKPAAAPVAETAPVEIDEGGRSVRIEAPVPKPVAEGGAPKIERIVDLGIKTLRAVGTTDGEIMFIADMGHYVIKGQLLDVWQKKVLRTIDEIAESVGRVDLNGMGYDKNSYAGYSLGTGPKRVVAFIDPQCTWCHRMLEEIASDQTLLRDYRFIFHVIPMLGNESSRLAKALWCADVSSDDKLKALREGPKAIDALPAQASCDLRDQDHTILLSGLIGVKAVPFVIAPDGRTSEGKPSDMRMFLENRTADAKKLQAEKAQNKKE